MDTTDVWPRVLNNDGEVRLEQTQPPNGYLVVKRNADDSEVVSTPMVTTEPKDEIIRLLIGALAKAKRAAAKERDWGQVFSDAVLLDAQEAYETDSRPGYEAMRAVLLAAVDAAGKETK